MADLSNADPDGCAHCTGIRDGYRVGPDGVTPDGQRANYDEALFPDPEYRSGLPIGRSERIDDNLRHLAERRGEDVNW